MTCPHCSEELHDDGISIRCTTHGPIAISELDPMDVIVGDDIGAAQDELLGSYPDYFAGLA